jgi:Phage tail tube protein
MGRVGGRISVKLNGKTLRAKGEFTCSLGGPNRKAAMGTDGTLHGYTEEYVPGYIEGDLVDAGDLSLTELRDSTDAIVTVDLANGKTIVLRRAFFTNPDGLTIQTNEGAVKVKWEGEAEELMGA